jgi:hypothetical protein
MTDSTYSLIRQAIESRRQIQASYAGHARLLCLHVIGAKAGEPRALFFQFGGDSARGLAPGGDWRCLPLAGLSAVSIHHGEWHTRPHSRPQRCVDQVDLEVRD